MGDDVLREAAAQLMDESRRVIAYHANAAVVATNWRWGWLIHVKVLHRGRADYSKQAGDAVAQIGLPLWPRARPRVGRRHHDRLYGWPVNLLRMTVIAVLTSSGIGHLAQRVAL